MLERSRKFKQRKDSLESPLERLKKRNKIFQIKNKET